jgi:lipopolysaccharide/colanic/teichoic acid biosynthesis glycosyltransferase
LHSGETVNVKRAFDIVAALTGLVIFAPLLLVLMALILIDDGRPLFFTQERIGRQLQPFVVFKLRTLRNGRITGIGLWLRKSGLDETPQFINVLNGSMSMVGPRPLTREDSDRLNLHDGRLPRSDMRPGITGMAQLYAGRGLRATLFLERIYFERQSLCLDSQILLLSLLMNIFGKQRIRGWLDRWRKWPGRV